MSSSDLPTIQVAITGEEEGKDRPELVDVLIANRYRVTRRLGKGGMGEVMLARDEQVGRDVAIKRMRAANPSERAILRFLREASVQGRLEHPAIVPVHEIGRDTDGLPFFVMKKLTGTSLATILADSTLPLQRVLRAFADVCIAVEFAHVRGIVHRDLKPDNIMLGDYGEVYVLDWGVAKVSGPEMERGGLVPTLEDEDGGFSDVDSSSGEHATAAGTAIGTPGYMAPEQVRGLADIDGRADIYTLGCLLYEILAGEPLHPRGPHGMQSALAGPDARPSVRAPKREIPPELDALCVHATYLDRGDRVQTARELGERVQRYLDGDRDLALRRTIAASHLETARHAFAAGDAHRPIAMREAASAIALDPSLAGAVELVARLMLEPPREVPPEVETAIVRDDIKTAKTIARAGVLAVLGAVVLMPLIWWISDGTAYVGLLGGALLIDGVLGIYLVRATVPRPELVVIANTLLVIVLSRMFSPIFIAPGIAASLAMAMVLTPRFSRFGSPAIVATLMIVAVLVPLALEQLGVVSRTMSVSSSGLLFSAPGLSGREGPTIVVGVVYVITLILGAVLAGASMREQTRAAHLRLHTQAWQLRQLVPAA